MHTELGDTTTWPDQTYRDTGFRIRRSTSAIICAIVALPMLIPREAQELWLCVCVCLCLFQRKNYKFQHVKWAAILRTSRVDVFVLLIASRRKCECVVNITLALANNVRQRILHITFECAKFISFVFC